MMWNFLEQRSFAADYWARVRYVAKMVGRTFLFPMLLIVNFNNNKGIASFKVAEGLTAFDGSEPHSILGSVSLSHRLWIPGLIVGEDLTDWEHLNWEEEPLNTELHPKALVLPEYDVSDVTLTLHSFSKELSLETRPERKQVHGTSAIYEGQISSTPALPLEDAQPVWPSDSLQTRDTTQTSMAGSERKNEPSFKI